MRANILATDPARDAAAQTLRLEKYARESVILRMATERGHVVFAEDNDDFRQVLTEGLTLLGFRVSAFPDGGQALQAALASDPPFVILTDLFMPKVSGYDLIDEMRERGLIDVIPVIVLSAVANPDLNLLVIQKPIEIGNLGRVLDVQMSLAGRYVAEATTRLAELRKRRGRR
jgi:CheY-like chemotaxis protein